MPLENIKVSVIITIYNSAQFLPQCLDSIVRQTLANLEIICVDDGSTDNSEEILQRYALNDKRIVIFRKENEGVGAASARNFGLEHAQGEYVSILDSDDFFDLNMLEKTVHKADATQADIVLFSGYEYDNANGNFYPASSILNESVLPQEDIFSAKDCPSKIFQISAGMAWNKLYRRFFLEKYNLRFQNIRYTDDAYFTFANMVLAKRITVVRERFCYYRVNSGSNQTARLSGCPDSAYLPYLKLKETLSAWDIYENVEQSLINCAVAFMRYFYDKIDRFDVFQYLHEKLRTDVFPLLDIQNKPVAYFYHERSYLWCKQVMNCSAGEVVFLAARAFGGDCTTGVLRFRFPYNLIPQGSRIVLVGARIMAQLYYAQAVMGSHCFVITCVAQENPLHLPYVKDMEVLSSLSFDYALMAYAEPWLIASALKRLKELGVSEEKIILGGNIS